MKKNLSYDESVIIIPVFQEKFVLIYADSFLDQLCQHTDETNLTYSRTDILTNSDKEINRDWLNNSESNELIFPQLAIKPIKQISRFVDTIKSDSVMVVEDMFDVTKVDVSKTYYLTCLSNVNTNKTMHIVLCVLKDSTYLNRNSLELLDYPEFQQSIDKNQIKDVNTIAAGTTINAITKIKD